MPFRSNLKYTALEPASPNAQAGDDKKAPGEKKAPDCPNCKMPTRWYQSKLQSQNGRSKIVHSFHCPNCGLVVQTEEPSKQALRVI